MQPVKPAPTVARVPTEPAQPSDWRESWGKIEPWKGAPADAARAAQAPPKRVAQTPAPKRVTYVPVQIEPPKQPDPLKDPAWFGDTALQKKLSNSKIPRDKGQFASSYHIMGQKIPAATPPAPSVPPTRIVAAPAPAQPIKQPQPAPLPPVKQPQPPAPPVRETASLPPPQGANGTVEIPANEANAFWAPEKTAKKEGEQADSAFNAFDRENNAPPPTPDGVAMAAGPQRPMPMAAPAMGPMPMPMPPRPPMPPPMPDTGVPSGMANAFTLAGTRRPIPADFGGTPQEPNGFGNAVPFMDLQGGPPRPYAVPRQGMMMPYPGMQRPMMVNPLMSVPPTQVAYARPAAAPAGPVDGTSPLLAALNGSLYPSEREQAAEQLSEQNWRTQPQIVEGLMKGARDDPAATVRAACVRALAHMKANTVGVTSLVQLLKNDRDARVRHEAEEALTSLGVAPTARQDGGVQQASHR